MKKTGNFCIRALCAIFVGVVLGCSGGGGGSDIEDNGGDPKVEHKFIADICGEEHKCQVAGCTEHGYTHPTYMNVTADFGGQRFVESNDGWYYDNDKNAKFTTHYDAANQYIDCKVIELQKLWREENTNSPLSSQIGTALQSFNNGSSISQNIDKNYNALAPVFKVMAYSLVDNDKNIDFNRFNVSYYKLAADAFNQSIGRYAVNDSNKRLFETNSEMINDKSNFFGIQLTAADLSYSDATNRDNATARMNNYLITIAANTKTDFNVLKKVVELALYNESLYGLNDFAVKCTVSNQGLTNTPRVLNIFRNKQMNAVYNISNVQNIDDRTM